MTGFAAPSPAIRASGLEGATHSMLGLGALGDEMAGQGIAARTGGDEFAVIFPNSTPAQASAIVSSIREELDSTPVMLNGASDAAGPHVRAAVGLAALDEFNEVEQLLRRADSALYENKRELGRLNDRRRAS